MKEYVIITDSCCDLTPVLAAKACVEVIPMTVNMDDREYLNYLDGREIESADFYAKLRDGKPASTSAINIEVFNNYFEPHLKEGRDILYLAFSSGLSSTYHVSTMVADELITKYPDRKIYCVDTLSASMGEGLLVYLCAMEKQKGADIDEVKAFAEKKRLHLCHWFTVDDLNHLKRGGRVSATTALVGSVLNIKPILHVDDEGHLINVGKVRGRRASILNLFDNMKNTVIDPQRQTVFISHGDCADDAELLADMVKKEFHIKELYINNIGPVIGAHSGPGTLALFFLGTHR